MSQICIGRVLKLYVDAKKVAYILNATKGTPIHDVKSAMPLKLKIEQ